MSMTLRTHGKANIDDFRKDIVVRLDRNFDKTLDRLAIELNVSKSAIMRQGAKMFAEAQGVDVSGMWF